MSVRRVLLLIGGICAGGCMLLLMLFCNLSARNNEMLHNPSLNFTENADGPTVVSSLPAADITLPCAINGTSLIAERLVSYEGSFVENGDSAQMVMTSALLIRNTGAQGVIKAVVTLERGSETFTFEVTSLPPGESALVLERDAKSCFQDNFTACIGWEVRDDSDWLQSETIFLTPVDIQTLSVTNLTESAILDVRLYYKTVYADGLFYIGGITHEVRLEALAPGETRLLRPEYYADIHSRIVRVTVENE